MESWKSISRCSGEGEQNISQSQLDLNFAPGRSRYFKQQIGENSLDCSRSNKACSKLYEEEVIETRRFDRAWRQDHRVL
jgi:hypothetical protein